MSEKLLAEWFWTDRWMGSRGFLLPLEARGLYREMLTQAWRRGAQLPNDHDAIQRAVGAKAREWARAWPLIQKFWRVEGDSIVNDTQLEIYKDAKGRNDRASKRGLSGAQARHKHTISSAQALLEHKPPSPSPSPSPSPISGSDHSSPKERSSSADADFGVFLQAYPVSRRVGGKPGKAAFQRSGVGQHGDSLATVLLALEQQKRSEQWQTPKLIPLMTTWLNQERWLQVLPETGDNSNGVSDQTRANLAARDRVIAKMGPFHDA